MIVKDIEKSILQTQDLLEVVLMDPDTDKVEKVTLNLDTNDRSRFVEIGIGR